MGETQRTEKWASKATKSEAIAHGLTEQEFQEITSRLGRPLSILELGIVSALYSEHCSYKSTKVHLKTLPTSGPRVLQGPGENAGVIDIGDGECVVFKVESHNHPSFIEPYQGAATGVGGILRDIFTMGARPLALMNGLRFGDPQLPKSQQLLRRAVAGIGGYGNCVGVPTVGGELYFDPSYNGNCLVNAFALGVAKHEEIYLARASGVGNPLIYFGSKTGRDGIRGANMASEAFDDNSEEKRPTVQVGDPFQEKLLIEATLALLASGCVVGIQDMGAAGMTCACYEMAERAGSGITVNLTAVPQRETGMNPYEIMLSESQERMLAVVAKGREQEALAIIRRWELDAAIIGEVVEGQDVTLIWEGQPISVIPAPLLTASVPQYRWPEAPASEATANESSSGKPLQESPVLSKDEAGDALLSILGDPNGCSRRRVYEQYDSTVRTNTVMTGDAGVIRIKRASPAAQTEKGLAMTLDCNSRYCGADPRAGTALSLAEAIRNLACVGAEPLGISDCLNCGSPERPESMRQIAECIRGLGDAARAFGVPVVSGNVSLYNETKGEAILPTPTLAVVGLIPDVSVAVPSTFREKGDVVLVVGSSEGVTLGGSLFSQVVMKQPRATALPVLVYDDELKVTQLVRALVRKRVLRSCHDVSDGGLATAVVECCFERNSGPLGVELSLGGEGVSPAAVQLFGEGGCRFVVSCDPSRKNELEAALKEAGVAVLAVGSTGGDHLRICNESGAALLDQPLTRLEHQWSTGLDPLFGLNESSRMKAA